MKINYHGKPVFYGWYIVAGLVIINMVSVGFLHINYGLFIDPITKELGISQTIFGWSQTARLVGGAVALLVIGRILDAYGARITLMFVALLACVLMLAASSISSSWQIIVIFTLLGVLGLVPGAGIMYAMVTLSQWFVRDRGKAMSIMSLGFPIGIFFILPLTQLLISSVGWRDTVVILGVVGGIVIFLMTLIIRRRPEDKGLLPDGDTVSVNPGVDAASLYGNGAGYVDMEYSWTRSEAVRTPAFWMLTLCTGLYFFSNAMSDVFRIPYFVSLGIDAQIVSYSLSLEAAISIVTAFPLSYLMRRVPIKYIISVSYLAMVVYFIIAINTTQVWHVFLAQVFFGMSVQTRIITEAVIWPTYFGKRNIGSIRGLAVPLTMLFSFMGAPIAGIIYDRHNSYVPAWWMGMALLVVSALLFITMRQPRVKGTLAAHRLAGG